MSNGFRETIRWTIVEWNKVAQKLHQSDIEELVRRIIKAFDQSGD